MVTKEKAERWQRLATKNSLLALSLVLALFLATLTLWIPGYWPVGIFEIAVFLIAGIALIAGNFPAPATAYPLCALSFIVLWGCFQLIAGRSIVPFETERATLQWMTWTALYYIGASTLREKGLGNLVRTAMVWFGFAVAVEAILQAYLSPGKVIGIFPTGYHEFVMGPIIYHTHFAAFVETILPLSLFQAVSEAKKSYTYLGISAVLFTAVVVSASRGGLLIVLAEILCVLVLLHLRKTVARRKIRFLALVLVGVTGVLASVVGFETALRRFYSEAWMMGGSVGYFHPAHDRGTPLDWLGTRVLACGLPGLCPLFDPGAIVNQAHTNWLQWTAEGGLPGRDAMLSLAVWAARPTMRTIWGIGVIAVLLHAGFDYPFSRPALGAWPILVLSMAAASQDADLAPARTKQG